MSIWRQRTRELMERYRIAYFYRAGRAFDLLAQKVEQRRNIRITLIRSEIKKNFEKCQTSFRFWRSFARKRYRVRLFMTVKRKQQQYSSMDLLELSPFIGTAGDSTCTNRGAKTLLEKVFTAWKAGSIDRFTIVRRKETQRVLAKSFLCWIDFAARCMASKKVTYTDHNDERIAPTLLDLASGFIVGGLCPTVSSDSLVYDFSDHENLHDRDDDDENVVFTDSSEHRSSVVEGRDCFHFEIPDCAFHENKASINGYNEVEKITKQQGRGQEAVVTSLMHEEEEEEAFVDLYQLAAKTLLLPESCECESGPVDVCSEFESAVSGVVAVEVDDEQESPGRSLYTNEHGHACSEVQKSNIVEVREVVEEKFSVRTLTDPMSDEEGCEALSDLVDVSAESNLIQRMLNTRSSESAEEGAELNESVFHGSPFSRDEESDRMNIEELLEKSSTGDEMISADRQEVGFPIITPSYQNMLKQALNERAILGKSSSLFFESQRQPRRTAIVKARNIRMNWHLGREKENRGNEMRCRYTVEDPKKPFRRTYTGIYFGDDSMKRYDDRRETMTDY